jgi:ankyrin repeat protein
VESASRPVNRHTISQDLIQACFRADIDAVREAIAAGAVVNERYGRTGLSALAATSAVPPNADQWTPLLALANSPASNGDVIAIARLLMAAGADPNADDGHGGTPLYDTIPSHEDLALLLIDHGANVNTKTAGKVDSATGFTPLHQAAGHPKVIAVLLAKGADVKAATGDAATPLHAATLVGDAESVRLLLAAGADPNAKDAHGETPLHFAVSAAANRGDVEAVKVLLEHGADPKATDSFGISPMDAVASPIGDREKQVAELLRKYAPLPVKGPETRPTPQVLQVPR